MINDTQTVLSHILKNTYTVGDINRRLGVLRQTVEHVLFTHSDTAFMEACATFLSRVDEVDAEDARALLQWDEPVFTAFTQQNVAARMTELHAMVDSLPLLTLYIPVAFPLDEMTSIGQWARANCDENVIMDVHIEPDVVGGCAFVWNDTYSNISFKSKVKEQKGLVTEVITGYAS
jgi:hypothetical protein